MALEFVDRPIHQAPLDVLRHLYFYTTQYGLSVRQFTGQHQRYWEELPERLRRVASDPQSLEVLIHQLEALAAGAEVRRHRRRSQLYGGKWAEKEIVLNAQLLSVLAAMPRDLVACGFRSTINAPGLPSRLRIVELRSDKDYVEPDLLLLGSGHLLMVEVKTRGGSTSTRKYPPRQLLNYLRLVDECQELQDPGLPDTFTHLILVPTPEPRWLAEHREWVITISDASDGRLKFDLDACTRLGRGKSSYDFARLRPYIDEVPIYYRTWEQLSRGFGAAVDEFDDGRNLRHWQRVVREIETLANRAGRYA